jgi:hypothetical protein
MRRDLARSAVVLVLSAVFLVVTGCGGGGHSPSEPEAPPTVDSLTLVKIDPATTTVLRRGSSVTVKAQLRYAMAKSTQGTILAFVLGAKGLVPTQGVPFALVGGNRGTVDMTVSFVVPQDPSAVNVIFDFQPDGATADLNVSASYSTQ